ncbi:MAG TPA: DUF3788 domain-containing protein [Candidatus Sulfotelmatobacter sp.]|nr:DUF3788 domain-containing protein [Candidatus Sulfotelmatobacter sp.]
MTTAGKKEQSAPSENAFAGWKTGPTHAEVASVLGSSLTLWNRLVTELKREVKIDAVEWHSGSAKYGWSLRLQIKKRNIVYLSPRDGGFVAAFALGDKAVAAARKSALPAAVIKNINESKRYAEGTAVRIDVRTAEDVEVVKKIAKIKIEN